MRTELRFFVAGCLDGATLDLRFGAMKNPEKVKQVVGKRNKITSITNETNLVRPTVQNNCNRENKREFAIKTLKRKVNKNFG